MKLAVFFPGIGYHCDKPLLYYSRKLVQEYGYEKIVTLNEEIIKREIRKIVHRSAEETLSNP